MVNMNYPMDQAKETILDARIAAVARAVFENDVCQQTAVLADLPEARLEALQQGQPASVHEMQAMCNALLYLSMAPGGEQLRETAVEATNLVWEWMGMRYSDLERKRNYLRSLVKASVTEDQTAFLSKYRIFMDSSALCAPEMGAFLDRLIPQMQALSDPPKITIPQAVIQSLEKLAEDPQQAELTGAGDGMKHLKRIQDAQLLSIRGDETDSTRMSTFISAFSRFKPTNSLVLLSEDEVLVKAVEMLNVIGIEGNDILAAHLNPDGTVQVWGAAEEPEMEPIPCPVLWPECEDTVIAADEPEEEIAAELDEFEEEEVIELDDLEEEEVIELDDLEEEEAIELDGLEEEEAIELDGLEEEEAIELDDLEEEEAIELDDLDEEDTVELDDFEEEAEESSDLPDMLAMGVNWEMDLDEDPPADLTPTKVWDAEADEAGELLSKEELLEDFLKLHDEADELLEDIDRILKSAEDDDWESLD